MVLARIIISLCYFGLATCHVFISPLDHLNYNKATIEPDPSITFSASPETLKSSGSWVTLSWSGLVKPSSDDWIGAYVLPAGVISIDPAKIAPVKFQYCDVSHTHLTNGNGSLKFYLVNMRSAYRFGLFKNGFKTPTLAATSKPVQFTNPNEPLQGHLMLTGDPTEMKLMWVSRDTDNPEVKYGLTYGTAVIKSPATSMTYKASDMCGPPANSVGFIDPGQLHTAILKNLSPGQKFSYSFGDEKNGWSKMYNFTMPPINKPNVRTKIIAYGGHVKDMGQGQQDDSYQPIYMRDELPSLNTTRLVEAEIEDANLILHIGDISYAIGYAGVWEEFFDQIQLLATRVPYMVSIGNHERDYPNSGSYYPGTDSGGECGVPYDLRFPMPRPGRDQDWYTFSMGHIQFVLMSTEHNFTTGSKQYKWISETLSSVNKSQTPWLIFSGHRPMYCDSTNDETPAGDLPVANELRQHIEPLLMQYKVDLALWGHHHSYQRTCPVYQGKCTDGAPVHAVIGMAGQGLSQNIQSPQPDWIEKVDVQHYGYTRITCDEKSLLFEYVRDDDGQVHDTLTLSTK